MCATYGSCPDSEPKIEWTICRKYGFHLRNRMRNALPVDLGWCFLYECGGCELNLRDEVGFKCKINTCSFVGSAWICMWVNICMFVLARRVGFLSCKTLRPQQKQSTHMRMYIDVGNAGCVCVVCSGSKTWGLANCKWKGCGFWYSVC